MPLEIIALHEKIFLIFYHVLGTNVFVAPITVFFAVWFPWILGAFPFVYELYLRDEGGIWRTLRKIYLAPVMVYCVTMVIKFLYQTPRPFALLEIAPAFVVGSDPYGLASFPSSHTAFFAALAVTMYFCNPRLGKWFFYATLAIGISRVGAGVHWPVDILGGLILGVVLGYIIEKALLLLYKNDQSKC